MCRGTAASPSGVSAGEVGRIVAQRGSSHGRLRARIFTPLRSARAARPPSMPTREDVYTELRQVFDPEIPVNIVDLGLVYDVKVEDGGVCNITMTLTSQSCPEARTIPEVMKRRVNAIAGISGTEIQIVWEPAWGPHRISPEGRVQLGIDPSEDEDE